ncbi:MULTISPECIES: hypothetical protein [unclassified Okeania]|uniref:hypothetical protein n=1 Tax=unclassified Okeania TaxID=2634635 RepID=UPI00257FC3E7|nr:MULTISPECIES: hypothetical protein [unclassified Okeania]
MPEFFPMEIRKREEGRRKKLKRKKEEGRRKREEGRGKEEEDPLKVRKKSTNRK